MTNQNQTVCRESGCGAIALAAGYCRLHYIKNWNKIKQKEMIIEEGKLKSFIRDLVARLPEEQLKKIRQDLSSESAFVEAIQDLNFYVSEEDLDEILGFGPDTDISDTSSVHLPENSEQVSKGSKDYDTHEAAETHREHRTQDEEEDVDF